MIELELREVNQLFNLLDPSPFHERDLNRDAEEFIVSWAQEYPLSQPLRLTIHLDSMPTQDPTALMTEAVHNFFAYRTKLNRLEFRRLMAQGRTSLIIGLAFLAGCIGIGRLLLGGVVSPGATVLRESLTIAGWVAMWRPIQIYLHDWWPVRRRGRILAKLSTMPVEVVKKTPRSMPGSPPPSEH